MRKRGRVDANQSSVVAMLRKIPGVSVQILSNIGNGCPDLVIGFRGSNYLIELKDGDKVDSQKKLTVDELSFFEKWTGQVNKCENIQEILAVIGCSIK